RVVNYRKIQIDKLKNVEFIPDTKLDAKGVAEYGAEIVIVATGAYWATDGLNGATHDTITGADASLPHVLTPEQIMVDGKAVPGSRVIVTQRRSNEALFRELKDSVGIDGLRAEGVEALYRIGDCEAPRLIADAIFSGHRLAREIDTDNPAVALPFKRERRVPDTESLERDLEELRARRDREAVPA